MNADWTPRYVLELLPEHWPEPDDDAVPPPRDLGVPLRSWDYLTEE